MNKYALDLIKSFEGLKLNAYQDGGGVWTIGYGETNGVKKGMVITKEQAEDMLKNRLAYFEAGVWTLVGYPISLKQLGALISLTYNIGLEAFKNSTLLRLLHAGKPLEAADEFLKWNHDNGKVEAGLTRRRKAERDLFLSSD